MNIEQIIDAGYARCGAETAYGFLAVKDLDGCVRVFINTDSEGSYELREILHREGDLPAALELWARPWAVAIADTEGKIVDDLGEEYVFAARDEAAEWVADKHEELGGSFSKVQSMADLDDGDIQSPTESEQTWIIYRRDAGGLTRFGAYETSLADSLKF